MMDHKSRARSKRLRVGRLLRARLLLLATHQFMRDRALVVRGDERRQPPASDDTSAAADRPAGPRAHMPNPRTPAFPPKADSAGATAIRAGEPPTLRGVGEDSPFLATLPDIAIATAADPSRPAVFLKFSANFSAFAQTSCKICMRVVLRPSVGSPLKKGTGPLRPPLKSLEKGWGRTGPVPFLSGPNP